LLKGLTFILAIFNFSNIYSQDNEHKYILKNLKNWVIGNSDSIYFFKAQEYPKITSSLIDAFQVKRAREFWYNKNIDAFNSGNHQWQDVSNFSGRFQTIKGVIRAKFDFFEQVIGGFTVHIKPINKDTLKFIVYDIKSKWSLFYHLPFVKNTPYNNSLINQKPMTNMIWWIEWTEPVKTALFYQRQYNQLFIKKKYSGHYF
jgi:hypothetical protein